MNSGTDVMMHAAGQTLQRCGGRPDTLPTWEGWCAYLRRTPPPSVSIRGRLEGTNSMPLA